MGYMFQSDDPEQGNNTFASSFEPRWRQEEAGNPWQIIPPIVNSARIPVVKPHLHLVSSDAQQEAPSQNQSPPAPQHESAPLFRLSFVGSDQQWYSVSAAVGQRPPVLEPGSAIQTAAGVPHRPPQGYMQTAPPPWDWAERLMPDATAQKDSEVDKNFLLQIVQPGLAGLMDGSVSTLAPIFAVAFATHHSFTVFLVGLASALGAGISMTFSEALSDDGEITGRGKPFLRGGVTGLMTFLSGAGHALPFLIPNIQLALVVAYVVVACELLGIAAIRHKYFGTNWGLSIAQVVGGGILVFIAALLLGNA